MKKKKFLILFSIIFFGLSIFSFYSFYYLKPFYEIDVLNNIEIKKINTDVFVLEIKNVDNSLLCGSSNIGDSSIKWNKSSKCELIVDDKLEKVYIKKHLFVRSFKINDLVIGDNLPKKVFLVLNESIRLDPKLKLIGNISDIQYKSDNGDIVSVRDNRITGKKVGKTKIVMTANGKYTQSVDVEVTNLIVKRPKKFNDNKKNLSCNRYSEKDAKKLDEILAYKIDNVGGYGTRAAVVEAIRFLLLDFPYQIEYFFENGRLEGGVHFADGEGRYYHKGLYLNDNKFKDIKGSYAGPAIWGCPLKNFEDWGNLYKRGQYKPNGLDCSGFVSWSILNGGFDVGDRGAGDNEIDETELNDIGGEKVTVTDEFIKSGRLKAGDLLGIWGHIAIVAGIDDENVYVAESLWTFGGPVINTYKKDKVDDKFVQAVLLDDVYKEDGLYTDMW